MSVRRGSVAHRLLSVACAESQPLYVLGHRLNAGTATVRLIPEAAERLVQCGYLSRTDEQRRRQRCRYALTPAGEVELDRLWGEA